MSRVKGRIVGVHQRTVIKADDMIVGQVGIVVNNSVYAGLLVLKARDDLVIQLDDVKAGSCWSNGCSLQVELLSQGAVIELTVQ